MSKRSLVIVMSCAVLAAATVGDATASERSGTTPKLCDLVAPTGTGGAGKPEVDPGNVAQIYPALQQASSFRLPKKVKKAIKTLLPLYEKLASGKGGKALITFSDFVEEQCGADATASGGKNAGDVDPCALLTLDDAQRIAGTPLNPATASGVGNPTVSCTYMAPVTGPIAQVEFYIGPGAKKALDIDRDLKHPIAPVADLGSEAYSEPVSVFWQQKGTWFWIRLVRLDAAGQSTAPVEALAREISERL